MLPEIMVSQHLTIPVAPKGEFEMAFNFFHGLPGRLYVSEYAELDDNNVFDRSFVLYPGQVRDLIAFLVKIEPLLENEKLPAHLATTYTSDERFAGDSTLTINDPSRDLDRPSD